MNEEADPGESDSSEPAGREHREQFLRDLSKRAYALSDPEAVVREVVRSLGEYLQVDRCLFADIDLDADTATVHPSYCATESVLNIKGVLPFSAFGAFVVSEYRAGRATVVDDVRNDPLRVPPETRAAYEALCVGAHIAFPAVYSDRLVGVIALHCTTARHWLPEEVALVGMVVERTWLAVENARLSHALRQESEQRREQEEHLRRLIDSSPDCIKTLDLDGTILSISESGLRLLEIGDASTVCGLNWATFFWEHEETRTAFFAARDIAVAGGMGRFHGFCPTTTGKPMWWDVVIVPLLGADGKPEKLLSTSRDITAQRAAEREAARVANEVRLITDAAPLLISYLDTGLRYRFVNRTYEEWFGRSASEFVGKHAEEIIGPVAFARVLPHLQAALAGERVSYEGDMPYPNAGRRYVDIELVPDIAEDGVSVRGFVAVIADITTRREAELRVRFLSELGERTRFLSDPDAVVRETLRSVSEFLALSRCTFANIDLDTDTCTIPMDYCAEGVASIAGVLQWSAFGPVVNSELIAGRAVVVEDVHVDHAGVPSAYTVAYDHIGVRAHVTVPIVHSARLVSVISAQSAIPRRWVPEDVALLQTVAERTWLTVEVARQQRALREIEQRERDRLTNLFMQAPAFMAALRGPNHVFEMANPPYYQLVGHGRDIIGKPVVVALPEVVDQGFLTLLDRVYQTGEPFIGKDVRILLRATTSAPLEERFIDFTYQPFLDIDGTVTGILAHGIDLTERKRLEQERERLLIRERSRAEHAALLNQIGAAVRATVDPDAILQSTVSLLGQGLGADRCYFVRTDTVHRTSYISPEWYRRGAGAEPFTGRIFENASYATYADSTYSVNNTHVITDVNDYGLEAAASFLALPLRARIRVPIQIGDAIASLSVVMSEQPREWTPEEVRLVENVATLVRSALESASVQHRERNIAQQLQTALQPAPPSDLPGLNLKSFYRPALNEASVGGDFFDVFGVSEGCTALVVADLSGKGLAAAQQVALVRNMLRFTLYKGGSMAEAVKDLHDALVEHDLLTGFATLFVGTYDHKAHTLTYVNCGQEPGLIWRAATGEIEQMPPTAPVLGGFAVTGAFEQKTVQLSQRDVIVLFTDGLTDVGPSRKRLLSVAGVSDLIARYCRESENSYDAQTVVDHLIKGVDMFARGGIADDIALLVGVVGRAAASQ